MSQSLENDEHILDILRAPAPSSNKATPLFYAVRLLQALRDNELTYIRTHGNRPDRADQNQLVDELMVPVTAAFGDGSYVSRPPNLEPLSDWLHTNSQLAVVVQARLLARAIERTYQRDFPNQLRRYYKDQADPKDSRSFLVRAGDPVPVCDSIFGVDATSKESNFGTSPRNQPRWRSPDRLATILLAPKDESWLDLRLSFVLEDDMRNLERSPLRIATVHPARAIADDFDVEHGHRLFWNVRPNDPAANQRRLLDGIKAANDAGARLVVLPELCASTYDQDALADAWNATTGDSSVLVAGSYHEQVDGEQSWRNISHVYGRDGAMATVFKAVPYVHDRGAVSLVEDLEFHARPRIEVFCSDRMTMMVFVCADFLLDRLRDLARDLDVSLVVIPSMSAKSRVFRGLIDGHVAATQAVVVFANVLVSVDENSRGYVARPGPDGQAFDIGSSLFGATATQDQSGVAVLDFDRPDESRWIST